MVICAQPVCSLLMRHIVSDKPYKWILKMVICRSTFVGIVISACEFVVKVISV